MTSCTIKSATELALDGILAIAKQNDLDSNDQANGSTGFLVSGFSREEYLAFLSNILVATTLDGVLAGFCLAFLRHEIPVGLSGADAVVKVAGNEDFLLIKIVAVHPGYIGQGIGAALYRKLLRHHPSMCFYAAIVELPMRNEKSFRFHTRFGFRRVAEYTPPDGMERGLWCRRPTVIRLAEAGDVPRVVAIAAEQAQATKSPGRLAKEGYLMSGYPQHLYERWCASQNLLVACVAGQVEGFALIFPSLPGPIPSEVEDVAEAAEAAGSADFLLIKQVGNSLQAQGTGLGYALYDFILGSSAVPVAAQIILAPRNIRSINFHERMGFRFILAFRDGTRGVWCCKQSSGSRP